VDLSLAKWWGREGCTGVSRDQNQVTHEHDLFATPTDDSPAVVERRAGFGLGGVREARRVADRAKYAAAMEETRRRRAKDSAASPR